jgi:hypothetical protein
VLEIPGMSTETCDRVILFDIWDGADDWHRFPDGHL